MYKSAQAAIKNRIDWGLEQHSFIFSESDSWKSEIKMSAGLVSSVSSSLLDLQKVIFFLYAHLVFPLCMCPCACFLLFYIPIFWSAIVPWWGFSLITLPSHLDPSFLVSWSSVTFHPSGGVRHVCLVGVWVSLGLEPHNHYYVLGV
jgi:hypothetical protein